MRIIISGKHVHQLKSNPKERMGTNLTDNEANWEGDEQSFIGLVEDGFILVVD